MANLAGQSAFSDWIAEVQEALFDQTAASTSTYPTLARIKALLNKHYKLFCARHNWEWLKDSATVATVAGTSTVTLADATQRPLVFRIANIGQAVPIISRAEFLLKYPYGWTNVGNSVPVMAVETEPASNNALQYDLWPTPDAVYTLTYDYLRRPTALSADADVPIIPPEFDAYPVHAAIEEAFVMLGDERAAWHRDRKEEIYQRAWRNNEDTISFLPHVQEYGAAPAETPGLIFPYQRY